MNSLVSSKEHKRELMERMINLLLDIVNKNSLSFQSFNLPDPSSPFDNIIDISVESLISSLMIGLLIYSLVLLDKFSRFGIIYYALTNKNVFLLLICSILISQKILYDVPFKS